MKITVLEKLIEKIEDPNLFSITELLINAVREYPLFELDDTDLYFEEVKKKIGADEITYNLVYGSHLDFLNFLIAIMINAIKLNPIQLEIVVSYRFNKDL